jgi:hypothetical protein
MGPPALLPLRRNACWGFFSPLKIRRLRPGLNPRTWVLEEQKKSVCVSITSPFEPVNQFTQLCDTRAYTQARAHTFFTSGTIYLAAVHLSHRYHKHSAILLLPPHRQAHVTVQCCQKVTCRWPQHLPTQKGITIMPISIAFDG